MLKISLMKICQMHVILPDVILPTELLISVCQVFKFQLIKARPGSVVHMVSTLAIIGNLV